MVTVFHSLLSKAILEVEGKYVPIKGVSISEEECYVAAGFTPQKSLSAIEIAELSVALVASEKKQELVDLASSIDLKLPNIPSMNLPNVAHSDLARMLATYLRENQTMEISNNGRYILVSDLVREIALSSKTYTDISSAVASDLTKTKIIPQLPKFSTRRGAAPMIYKDKFIVPEKLTDKEIKEIHRVALNHAFCMYLDIPTQVYLSVVKNLSMAQRVSNTTFVGLFLTSKKMGRTIQKLIEDCGLCYIDRVAQFKNTGCLIYKEDMESCRVYSANSIKKDDFVVLPDEVVEDLHRRKILASLYWKDGEAYMKNGSMDVPVGIIGGVR